MRWLISWVLFWLGHFVSRTFMRLDLPGAYLTYNKLMIWSEAVQGDGPGAWKPRPD